MEVQGNYPNFKQTWDKEEIFIIPKSTEASRWLANAVSEQRVSKSW